MGPETADGDTRSNEVELAGRVRDGPSTQVARG